MGMLLGKGLNKAIIGQETFNCAVHQCDGQLNNNNAKKIIIITTQYNFLIIGTK